MRFSIARIAVIVAALTPLPALAQDTVPTSIRRSCGDVIARPSPFPSVGFAAQLRLSSVLSRSSGKP